MKVKQTNQPIESEEEKSTFYKNETATMIACKTVFDDDYQFLHKYLKSLFRNKKVGIIEI